MPTNAFLVHTNNEGTLRTFQFLQTNYKPQNISTIEQPKQQQTFFYEWMNNRSALIFVQIKLMIKINAQEIEMSQFIFIAFVHRFTLHGKKRKRMSPHFSDNLTVLSTFRGISMQSYHICGQFTLKVDNLKILFMEKFSFFSFRIMWNPSIFRFFW